MSALLLEISSVLGYIAIGETLLIYISTKRNKILALKIISDILWMLNHFFCGAITGGVLNGIGIIRGVIFTLKDKYKIFHHVLWPVAFVIISFISTFLSWEGMISLLPMIGSIIIIPALYTSNLLITKSGAVIGQSFWLIYDVLHLNTTAIICGIIAIISGIIGLIIQIIQCRRLKEKKLETIET